MSRMQKTRILCVALIIAIVTTIAFPFGAYAAEYTSGDYTYTVSNGKATITQYNGDDVNVVIPSTLGGYPVKSIGSYAFQYCDFIKKIEMPSVETIGWGAFWGCDRMRSASMPNVTQVGTEAFVGCMALVKLDMPSVKSIGGHAFPALKALTTVNMPRATSIGEGAFLSCKALTKISIPAAKGISADAFSGCDNVTIYASLNSYAHKFAVDNGIKFSEPDIIKSVTHRINKNKITFTITTSAGDYNRIKLAYGTKTGEYISYTNTHTVNANGDYVWTLTTSAPEQATFYAFDLRSSETGNYLKDYFYYNVELVPLVKSVSHEIGGGKIIFTVVTSPGAYNRIKVTTADNLSGSIGISSTYTVNADGNYVWVIKSSYVPSETTNYAFDLRSSETGKYLKDYSYYKAEIVPLIKSINCQVMGRKTAFYITTSTNDFNRIKVTLADDLNGYIAYTSTCTQNVPNTYSWTIIVPTPKETTNYAFDLRSAETGKYLKYYHYYTLER
ncbi:MAG: leucine-rich repeat domain-containing protein [Clostridia bacterium]|nr:leucine-rich repeat domain-containing protein [Clostridia bacterium]